MCKERNKWASEGENMSFLEKLERSLWDLREKRELAIGRISV